MMLDYNFFLESRTYVKWLLRLVNDSLKDNMVLQLILCLALFFTINTLLFVSTNRLKEEVNRTQTSYLSLKNEYQEKYENIRNDSRIKEQVNNVAEISHVVNQIVTLSNSLKIDVKNLKYKEQYLKNKSVRLKIISFSSVTEYKNMIGFFNQIKSIDGFTLTRLEIKRIGVNSNKVSTKFEVTFRYK